MRATLQTILLEAPALQATEELGIVRSSPVKV
jgi:hypothetical protein